MEFLNERYKHSMRTSPIAQSIKILVSNYQRSTGIFYCVLFLVFCILISVGFSPRAQKLMMGKYHFMPRPFVQWAVLQFVPSMYNFKNDFYASVQPVSVNAELDGRREVQHFSINHYPLRMLYFRYSRQPLIMSQPFYVNIRTVFRNQEIVTSYVMITSPRDIQIHFLNTYEHTDGQ